MNSLFHDVWHGVSSNELSNYDEIRELFREGEVDTEERPRKVQTDWTVDESLPFQ